MAGKTITLYIRARDKFGNAHCSGGAIKNAIVQSAGQLCIDSSSSLVVIQASQSNRPDTECNVDFMGNGAYRLQCVLYGTGTHSLVVTDTCKTSLCMATVRVAPSTAYPLHCRLDPSNSYRALAFREFTFYMYIYDAHFNPCCLDSHSHIVIYLGFRQYQAKYTRSSKRVGNHYAVRFSPLPTSYKKMDIALNGTLIGDSPVDIHVKHASLQERLEQLWRSTRSVSVYAPTITVDRANLLESALQNSKYFHAPLYIRFGDEPGVDLGGVAR